MPRPGALGNALIGRIACILGYSRGRDRLGNPAGSTNRPSTQNAPCSKAGRMRIAGGGWRVMDALHLRGQRLSTSTACGTMSRFVAVGTTFQRSRCVGGWNSCRVRFPPDRAVAIACFRRYAAIRDGLRHRSDERAGWPQRLALLYGAGVCFLSDDSHWYQRLEGRCFRRVPRELPTSVGGSTCPFGKAA